MDEFKLKLDTTLEGHTDRVWCVRWHPNGQQLASCSADRSIRLWAQQTSMFIFI